MSNPVLEAPAVEQSYSCFDEQAIIRRYLDELPVRHCFCVDIAAGDGRYASNTFSLFQAGWRGVAVEWDGKKFGKLASRYAEFPRAQLARTKVTPQAVVPLLQAVGVPRDFDFLNLDIDSFDYFVLDRVLQHYRPSLVCAEINEKIPPPVKFTVTYDAEHVWREDHFYGQSIAQLDELRQRHDYVMVELEYCNAFLIPREISPVPHRPVHELYRDGYLLRADRLERMPWNKDVEALHDLEPEDAVRFVCNKFSAYRGKFHCTL